MNLCNIGARMERQLRQKLRFLIYILRGIAMGGMTFTFGPLSMRSGHLVSAQLVSGTGCLNTKKLGYLGV